MEYSGHRQNLRKRFEKNDLNGFVEHEVVEFLLTHAIPRRDVKPYAKKLLRQFSSLRGILDAHPRALSECDGIGSSTAIFLKFIREICHRYMKEHAFAHDGEITDCRKKLRDFWTAHLGNEPFEINEIAYLNAACELLPEGLEQVTIGTATGVIFDTRKICEGVMMRKCAAVILCHNHPNGDPRPSEHDERNTDALRITLHNMGVKLIDHLVVARNCAFSIDLQREI